MVLSTGAAFETGYKCVWYILSKTQIAANVFQHLPSVYTHLATPCKPFPVCNSAYSQRENLPCTQRAKNEKQKFGALKLRLEPQRLYSPPEVDRIWVWVNYNENPIYPIFYLLKGDDKPTPLAFSIPSLHP